MIDRSDPTIETRRETSRNVDEAAAQGWFYDPENAPMAAHFKRHRLAERMRIVEWLRGHNLGARSYTNGELADLIETGEHKKET